MYDVVVIGGSVSGLLCAREIASNKFSVLVIEEDAEIGTPEHCSGLVSSSGLTELGIIPSSKTWESTIKTAEIFAPNGHSITINAQKQNVIELSRRELDKQIAQQAQKNGVHIRVNTHVQKFGKGTVTTKNEAIQCKIIVDARGVKSLAQKDVEGILPSAQYEVYADWIQKDKIQIYFDQKRYPGFFAWVIPFADKKGKVGVAGDKINSAKTLEDFLQTKGKHFIVRKIFAPIWIKGPIKEFIQKDHSTVIVGDAAGQTKPTTAGGIYTAGIGGILAGTAISKYLKTNNTKDLQEYQKQWQSRFGTEFKKQILARKALDKLDNDSLDKIFSSISLDTIKKMSQNEQDFDFHASSIIKLLGPVGTLKTVQTLISSQIKKNI